MSKKNVVKAMIDKIFDAELAKLPKFEGMAKGQIEEFRGKFLEYMISDIAGKFLETDSVDTKLAIARFFFDYSGHKPKVEVETNIVDDPFHGMSLAQLDEEERILIGHGAS